MTFAAPYTPGYAVNPVVPSASVANFFIGFAVFLGGFVLFEPAPYELLLAVMFGFALLAGFRLPRGTLPILVPTVLLSVGGLISTFQVADYTRGFMYNTVTLFLGFSTVFFAVMIKNDSARLRLIARLYVAAAVVSSLLGIAGYFGMPGLEIFTRYGRAQGAFADPNVFAPFLVFPILYLIYGVLKRSWTLLPVRLGLLVILLMGEFLAFSRAGWGLTLLCAGLFYFLLLVVSRDPLERFKLILLAVVGVGVVAAMLAVALQFEAVYSIFTQRARIVQDYDAARLGRFARHLIGFEMALSKPLGIGTLEFGFIYGEDEHNVYLRSLLTYGWLGFVSWMTLILWPLIAGFKLLFRNRPWRPYLQIAYVVFFGHLLVAWVIDIDHWRHFYLTMGMIWGCILLEKQWQRNLANAPQRPQIVMRNTPLPQAAG